MNILGLHFDHDGSAAIVSDGKILCAISSERITKIKKMKGVTSQVINYVLQESNMTIEDIDAISLSDYNIENSHGTLKLFDNETQVNVIRHVVHGQQYLELTGVLMNKILPVYVIPHHTSHAAAAYYTSNFEKSWCFSMDSSNNISQANSLIMYGDGNQLIAQDYLGMMIGVGYELFTDFTGIGNPIFKAGSTMGLASYGKISKKIIDDIGKYIQESYFPINTTEDVFFKYYENLWKDISGKLYKTPKHQSYSYESMELAATIQYLFEKCILDVINNKIPKNEINNLCLSGGSFLNCNVNSKIKQDSRFKNIHLFPACGDDGIPIGSALFVTHHIFNIPRKNHEVNEICYLGKNYEYTEPNYELIAKLISEGKIIAWFMGKSEYGPRALGARSILSDPRNFHNREIINFSIKKREWYRPLAPVVLEEKSLEWFDFDSPSPYMLFIAKVLKPEKIPAVVHIDGTARIQTINEKINKPYYKLIKEFDKQTGIPILINTSLNNDGEPILETPEDAILFFQNNKGIDVLVLNGEIFVK